MDKSKLALLALPLAVSLVMPQAFALDAGNTYLLDDFEIISIMLDIDENGNPTFEEVFITPEGGELEYVMNADTVRSVKISSDHTFGKIFGKTIDGDTALVIYQIDGDNVEIKAKIWTDFGKERIFANGEVIPLF